MVVDGVTRIGIFEVLVIISVSIIVLRRLICLIDAVIVVDVKAMDNAGYRHILLLHRGIDGVLYGLRPIQTVQFSLRLNGDACSINHFSRFFHNGLVTHNLGIFWTS